MSQSGRAAAVRSGVSASFRPHLRPSTPIHVHPHPAPARISSDQLHSQPVLPRKYGKILLFWVLAPWRANVLALSALSLNVYLLPIGRRVSLFGEATPHPSSSALGLPPPVYNGRLPSKTRSKFQASQVHFVTGHDQDLTVLLFISFNPIFVAYT